MPRPTKTSESSTEDTQQQQPLVNENVESGTPGETEEKIEEPPPTYEQLQKQLADSREEVKRITKTAENLREASTQLMVERNALKAKASTPVPAAPRSEAIIAPEDYTGPSQDEIYLSLVAGFTGRLDPLKLNDTAVKDLANSICGMSEVFYYAATRRASFSSKTR
jgi:hypothetical protein